MPDREKVIKGLNNIGREIVNTIGHGEAVPYLRKINIAIDLLKEQEAVVPKRGLSKTQTAWFCGACGFRLNRAGRFCSKCGQAVKWG